MLTPPVELTVLIRSSDGTSAEFYQTGKSQIERTLDLLVTPRLLAQPHLLLASEQGACMISCRGIDMILARTLAKLPLAFPVTISAASLDIIESSESPPRRDSAAVANHQARDGHKGCPLSSRVEIHTLGGWTINLRIAAFSRGNAHDERQLFAHLLNVPTIPFRLETGGFGLINPGNITRLNAWPKPEAFPETALPMEYIRQTAIG